MIASNKKTCNFVKEKLMFQKFLINSIKTIPKRHKSSAALTCPLSEQQFRTS